MSNELVVKNQSQPAINAGMPSQHEMDVMKTIALMAEGSSFYKKFQGGKSDVMMILLAARELGLPPMLALNNGIRCFMGNVEISARAMNALIRKHGHSVKTLLHHKEKCTIIGKRADNGDTETCSFTFEEAVTAGLVKPKGAWETWREDMLYARALSRLARRLFPDVIAGCYVEGELMEIEKPTTVYEASPAIQEAEEIKQAPEPLVSDEQAAEIDYMLAKCDPAYKKEVDEYLSKQGVEGYKVPMHMYKKVTAAAKKKADEFAKNKIETPTNEAANE